MNKWILSTFIVLLAVQGFDAQFVVGVISLVTTTVGAVFNVLLVIPSVIITFTAAFLAAISNVVLATLAALNNGIYTSIVAINATASNAANVSAYYKTLISNSSTISTFYGQLIDGNLRDVVTGVSYVSFVLGSVIVGCAPPQPPPISFLGDTYPSLGSCLSTSNTNCNSTTISCQSSALALYANYQIRNLYAAAQYIDTVSSNLNCAYDGPTLNNTQVLIDLWANVSAEASFYVNVNTSGPLLVYANASLSANVAAALNLTSNFLNNYTNATRALLTCANITRFNISDLKTLSNYDGWQSIYAARERRLAAIANIIALGSFNSSINSSLNALSSAAAQFQSKVNTIISTSYIYATAVSQGSAFNNMVSRVSTSWRNFIQSVNSTIYNIDQAKTNLVLNASSTVNASAYALISRILNDNSSQCLNFTSLAAEVLASYSLNVSVCGNVSDIQTQNASTSAANSFASILSDVSGIMDATNKCYETWCAGNLISPFSIFGVQCANDPSFSTFCPIYRWGFIFGWTPCPSTKANNLNSCLNNVIGRINGVISTLDSRVASSTTALNTSNNNTLSSLNFCLNLQANATFSAFAGISSNYTVCRNSTA